VDPTNSIVWTGKSFIGSLVSCGVGFQKNLDQKSVTCHQQPQGHNKQESTIKNAVMFDPFSKNDFSETREV
jgi:hypothetical protein